MQTRNEKGQFGSCQPIEGFKGVLNPDGRARWNKGEISNYEPGKTYSIKNKKKLALCSDSGIHFCKKAEDVWGYYSPDDSKYIDVYSTTKCVSDEEPGGDSKVVTKKLTLGERFMGAFEFASKFFKGMYAKRVVRNPATHSALQIYTQSGKAHSQTDILGDGVHQCLTSEDTAVSFSLSSYIHGEKTAFACRQGCVVSSKGMAVMAEWNGIAYAADRNAVAITEGKAAGVLHSTLVFTRTTCEEGRVVRVVKVDGEKVKPNTIYWYSSIRGNLMEAGEFLT